MNRKGQIFTLDLVFSLILLMLALGYVFRIAEANNYKMKEDELFTDLQRIGTAASERLVSHPDFICKVDFGAGSVPFFNCSVGDRVSGADKDSLAIPDGYAFELLRKDGAVFNHIAGDNAPLFDPDNPRAQNIYSETRQVLYFSGGADPTKAQIDRCMNPPQVCNGEKKYLMVKVWKQ